MRSIDVRIRHDDDTMITSFRDVKGIPYTTTNGSNEIFDLFIDKDFIDTYIDQKQAEIDDIRLRPHPQEFAHYFNR